MSLHLLEAEHHEERPGLHQRELRPEPTDFLDFGFTN